MTGQKLNRLAIRIRLNNSLVLAVAMFVGFNITAPVLGQSYSYAPPQEYGGGPSGSVSGNVLNYDGRGMGVLWRGGHAAGNAIGREESVSYISGMPYATFGETMLFGDARIARANRGGLAWSFGAGMRHYFADVDAVFGLNGYFDKDQLVDHFQGWGIGVELLSDKWEWRGNMYKPTGESRFQTGVRAADGSLEFSGSDVLFDRVRSFATALEGYDTEIGFLLPGRIAQERQIRVFGGGYAYDTEANDPIGWKARLQAQPMDFLELGLQVSNDRQFDTSLVFNVAVQLGGYRENRPSGTARYRFAEPVRRNLSIATGNIDVTEAGVPVLNADGTNLSIAHVSSLVGTAAGPGTAELPWNTIQQGQSAGADIVFVHAGSTYDLPDANAVILNSGDRILGEGLMLPRPVATTHLIDIPEIGLTALPPSPSFLVDSSLRQPLLSGALGNGVTLANDTEFSGFAVEGVGQDIVFGDNVRNVTLNQNNFIGSGRDGIRLLNPTGFVNLTDTVIESTTETAFHVVGGSADMLFDQSDPAADLGFGRIVNDSGNIIRIADTTGGSIVFSLATLDESGSGVLIENAAGNASIDNLQVSASDSHGISIVDSSGDYTFRASSRGQVLLENTALDAINIERLADGGSVRFLDELEINNSLGGGITFQQSEGEVNFQDPITIAGAAGTGINIENNFSTSAISFLDDVTVEDGAGIGVQIAGGQFADPDRASVRFGSTLTLSNQAGDNLLITNDSSDINFDQIISTDRGSRGIAMVNASGLISFTGDTNVDNGNNSLITAVEILNSSATIDFLGTTTVTGGLGIAGVINNPTINIDGNLAAATGDARILFEELVIDSDQSDSLRVFNSSSVTVDTGTILTANAASVDLEESGIRMEWESIDNDLATTATGAPTAIRIVNTFGADDPDAPSIFEVVASDTATGGTIENSLGAAVFGLNPGIVRLDQMFFDNNELAFDIEYTDLVDDPDGQITLTNSSVEDSNFIGFRGTNIPNLTFDDVFFDNNGDRLPVAGLPDGAETILLTYTEAHGTDFDDPEDYDSPYSVVMQDVIVADNSDDAVVIQALAGAAEAHLDLDVEDSSFTATDTDVDFVGLLGRDASPLGQFEDTAFAVRWNGPLNVNMVNNQFVIQSDTDDTLFGTDADHFGFDLINENDEDQTEILFQNNIITSTGDLFTDEDGGVRIELEGLSDVFVLENQVGVTSTEPFTGFLLHFESATDLTVSDNIVAGASMGIDIDRLAEASDVRIDGNVINVSNIGIDIRPLGATDLFGTVNNVVFALTDFRRIGTQPNGFILVNGNQVQ
jgi:hypothetical protein